MQFQLSDTNIEIVGYKKLISYSLKSDISESEA